MLEVKISNRLTCITTISGPANVVCLIDSGIFSRRRYYVFINTNTPLHSTPMVVSSFSNRCSKKKTNCFKDSIRGFSSDLSSPESKDCSVVSVSSKECFSQIPSRKADMFLPTVQNILKSSNNYFEGVMNVVDFLRDN